MKIKKKAAIAAAAFLTMTNFSACSNYNQDVYGPPVRELDQEETDTEIVSNDNTTQSETETVSATSEEPEGDEQQ
ncbi:MAG: hypothetical protein K2N71_03905 [Oscillospiraceae bacterium]|nr:hypothetical protein [Oscillospiraceae bacterium]